MLMSLAWMNALGLGYGYFRVDWLKPFMKQHKA